MLQGLPAVPGITAPPGRSRRNPGAVPRYPLWKRSSPHYYSWERSSFGFPFTSTPEEYGLGTDKLCVIGETSNDDKAYKMTCEEFYQSAYENGWSGVLVWMEYRTDGSSGCDELWYRYDLTKVATNAMNELIPGKIYPWNNAEQSEAA